MNFLQNWTTKSAQRVIIRARQIIDGPDHTYYVPELQLVLDDQTANEGTSLGVILKLDRRYDTLHELIMRTAMWADVMFNRVEQCATVVSETGKVIEVVDIRKEFGIELAEHELCELKRDNIFAIH